MNCRKSIIQSFESAITPCLHRNFELAVVNKAARNIAAHPCIVLFSGQTG